MKQVKSLSFVVLIVGSLFVRSLWADEVVDQRSNGVVNWTQGTVSAIGYGVAPEDAPTVKKRLLARRAAQLDAYRNLAEMVNGVRVTSETIVQQMVAQSDTVKTTLETLIKGAVMTSDHYQNEVATVTLTMSLDGRFIQAIAPSAVTTNTVRSQAADVYSDLLAIMPAMPSVFGKAYASENTVGDFVITNPEQLALLKSLEKLLKEKESTQVLETLSQKIAMYENEAHFTGVIIDASQVNQFELATIPRIRDPKGNIIYPTSEDLRNGNIKKRPVSYDFDRDDAILNQRVAVKPYVVSAQGIYKARHSDLVIDTKSAELLRSHQALLTALGNAGVMIVVAR